VSVYLTLSEAGPRRRRGRDGVSPRIRVTLKANGHSDPRACTISPARLRRADRPVNVRMSDAVLPLFLFDLLDLLLTVRHAAVLAHVAGDPVHVSQDQASGCRQLAACAELSGPPHASVARQ
jgi:hypothetical protein